VQQQQQQQHRKQHKRTASERAGYDLAVCVLHLQATGLGLQSMKPASNAQQQLSRAHSPHFPANLLATTLAHTLLSKTLAEP
jgi:hypothetical protein